jgi:UDP-N-acetylmuramoylalanine-D-glutamate ligase
MKHYHKNHPKNNSPECYFPACQRQARLLETVCEAERRPFQGGAYLRSPACSSLDQISGSPQAGEILIEWFLASERPISCGFVALEPPDTGMDKELER